MNHDINEATEHIIRERQRASRVGKFLWLFILIAGIGGWILWKWYSILIALVVAYIFGIIYSYFKAKKVRRETGLNIHQQEASFKNYSSRKKE